MMMLLLYGVGGGLYLVLLSISLDQGSTNASSKGE